MPTPAARGGGPADLDPWVGRWQRDVSAATAPAHDHSDDQHDEVVEAGRDLLARWREPHRRYHDLDHLAAVLTAVDLLAADGTQPDDVVVVARLAAWFHDAVYAGRPGRDESDSAELAIAVLTGLGLPSAVVVEVDRLVRLTADHGCADGDRAGALLSDADLAILAAPTPDYDRYTRAVRAEYAHVAEPAFRAGRAAVLRRLLAADPLFRTETGRRLWQQAARSNLRAELARIEG